MAAPRDWWRTAVVYQVYIRSFADADGDGLGDVQGIRSRLGYLRDLGVDGLWINPWYPSPQADGGYDVADYRDIDPAFGTLDDARRLVDEAHRLGLRVLLDVVPNHTSVEHAWFRQALASPPGSPARARYIFRPGRDGGDTPPNDWRSVFGGPAWARTTGPDGSPGEWYLHLFAREQPDLNWRNPDVRAEFEDVLRFWFDRGVDGFRIDVAHGMVKHEDLPDLGVTGEALLAAPEGDDHPHWDRPEVHDVFRGWRRVADSYDPPRVFVAEAWVTTAERLAAYLRPDELHSAFDFTFIRARWDATALRAAIARSLADHARVGAPVTWTLSNHDVIRHATRLARTSPDPARDLHHVGGDADPAQGLRRARAAVLLLLALPGSAYLYQGEELGLFEVEDLPEDLLQDPVFARSGGAVKGRDGCRVPLPWARTGPSLGFGPGPGWLPQPASWADASVEAQAGDEDSTLELYRRALAMRRARRPSGALEWLQAGEGVLAFRAEPGVTLVLNTTPRPVPLPPGRVLLASVPLPDGMLPGDAAAWLAPGS
ncbi:MAG: glycoside hydrolase family 13 protein [Thermoleophilia bacterium]|nr:glycoside hydrolase family 13 protein [Thermoleophilia bacterium]